MSTETLSEGRRSKDQKPQLLKRLVFHKTKFSIETLLEEIKPVNTEKHEFEYEKNHI